MANKYASVLQSGTNNFLTTAEMLNAHATDHFSAGVVGTITNTSGISPATGSFAVNAQGSPNMTVAVTAGKAYVSATPTGGVAQTVRIRMDAAENVTIAANSTGGTRYDFVYIKVDADKLNNPAVTGLDAVTLITQRSTTTPTDSNGAPSNSLLLAIVTVSNGASSISNANIADSRVRTGSTSLSSSVNVPTGSVGGAALSTSAITLGYAQITSNWTSTTVGSHVDVTGLSVTVTVPEGGRRIKVTAFAPRTVTTNAGATSLAIREGSTILQNVVNNGVGAGQNFATIVQWTGTASAGSHTYKVSAGQNIAGTMTVYADTGGTYITTGAAFILVEAI